MACSPPRLPSQSTNALDRQEALRHRLEPGGRIGVVQLDTEQLGDQRHLFAVGRIAVEQFESLASFSGG
jgi:hypothetical protein